MRILILEDERVAARRLERLSRQILGPAVSEVAVAHELAEARRYLGAAGFDLLLVDLDLAGDSGFDLLADDLGHAAVVIVSAHVDQAIEAFRFDVLDFVPKPVGEARLRKALGRVTGARAARAPDRLLVRSHGRADLVPLASVVRIAGADDYCEILLTDGRELLHDRRLADLAAELPGEFVRVHRSFLVNLGQVSALELRSGRPVLRHRSGEVTPVSRRRLSQLRDGLRRFARGGA
jgi:DNA-binding LytR/AlgR family response regulator